ncbi:MAG: hypothetical protein KKF30_15310 [Proteobacteria bacterium]|nr:hypothetical protein [Pseudomonadota bacterium]MBU4469693.1 hypothetical protein [Pseudomonadota bacterium]MCG2751776.1 hypothetical protein [Desulfobacteraceae bacterium]
MDSYLIRIYRRSQDEPEKIVGIIEDINSGLKQSFKNLAELCNTITTPQPQGSADTAREVSDDTN